MPSLTTTSTGTAESEISTHTANSISTTNSVQLEILKLLQEISREMKQSSNPQCTPNRPVRKMVFLKRYPMIEHIHQGLAQINIAGHMDMEIMIDQNIRIELEITKPKQQKIIAWEVAMHTVADGVS